MLAYKYTRKNINQKLMNTIPMAIKCQEAGTVDKCLWKGSSLFFSKANKRGLFTKEYSFHWGLKDCIILFLIYQARIKDFRVDTKQVKV